MLLLQALIKDIKIKNNYSTPVYIEGYTSGKKLIFTIYGKDTRPSGRQVEYVSETVGTTNPGETPDDHGQ